MKGGSFAAESFGVFSINPSHRRRSESLSHSFTGWSRSSVPGSTCFNAGGHPGPNCLIQADPNPRERGLGPLNSHR